MGRQPMRDDPRWCAAARGRQPGARASCVRRRVRRQPPGVAEGRGRKVEWVNPHAWIHIAVKQPDGKTDVWMVEGGSPNSLLRQGVTKDSLPVGTEIVVDGYQARDHTLKRANGRNITYPDGRKLFLGSSGTGAPTDGADPTDKRPAR